MGCLSADSFVFTDCSFAAPSPSVGNWLAGWRSHAPSTSATVAIRTKLFFISSGNFSTQQSVRARSKFENIFDLPLATRMIIEQVELRFGLFSSPGTAPKDFGFGEARFALCV